MPFGPILRREMVSLTRRGSTYVGRASSLGSVLMFIGLGALVWKVGGWERVSLAGQVNSIYRMFGVLVAVQLLATIPIIFLEVSRLVALERERKTLDALLTTRLTASEIVLDTVASGLGKWLVSLAAFFPILLLVAHLGGIDVRLVLLGFAALTSTVFALAGISVAAALGARTSREAIAAAFVASISWLVLPMACFFFLGRLWPWGGRMLKPAAIVLSESSPAGILLHVAGLYRRGTLLGAVGRMIGLEMVGGLVLIAWTIARLRPACRAADDGEGLALLRRLGSTVRRGRRLPCGDDPILWNEMRTQRVKSPIDRLLVRLIRVCLILCLLLTSFWAASPAFLELAARGYSASGAPIAAPEVHPFVRWLIYSVEGTGGSGDAGAAPHAHPLARWLWLGIDAGPPPGQARPELNTLLRQASAEFYVFFVIIVPVFASESVASELRRDTWSGLLATPLTAGEIIRSKMLGVLWRTRFYIAAMVGLWCVGLVMGAVHPIGFVASLLGLVATWWLFTALGIYVALGTRDGGSAATVPSIPGGLPFRGTLWRLAPPLFGLSIPIGAVTLPLIGWLTPFSYDDVHVLVQTGAFPRGGLEFLDRPYAGLLVVSACLLMLIAEGAVAVALTRALVGGFDALAGRPVHSRSYIESQSQA